MKKSQKTISIGDTVRLVEFPEWAIDLPKSSQKIFRFCVGKNFPVTAVTPTDCVLDVSGIVDKKFGGYANEIFVDRKYLKRMRKVK